MTMKFYLVYVWQYFFLRQRLRPFSDVMKRAIFLVYFRLILHVLFFATAIQQFLSSNTPNTILIRPPLPTSGIYRTSSMIDFLLQHGFEFMFISYAASWKSSKNSKLDLLSKKSGREARRNGESNKI